MHKAMSDHNIMSPSSVIVLFC